MYAHALYNVSFYTVSLLVLKVDTQLAATQTMGRGAGYAAAGRPPLARVFILSPAAPGPAFWTAAPCRDHHQLAAAV